MLDPYQERLGKTRWVRDWRDGENGLRLRMTASAVLLLLCGIAVLAQSWERLGPEGGMVVSLGAGPGGSLYLGTADGHVFGSGDRAESWELRGRVGARTDAVVTRLVVDPRDSKRVIAGVWYQAANAGGGVFESVDEGRSWKLLGLEQEAVRALEMAPGKPQEMVAGTRSGVFRSMDGGKDWSRISPEGDEEIRNLDSVAIDPRDGDVIYAGTYHLPWLTRDGGKTWKPVIAGIIDDSDIMSLRLDATNPSRVYMSACSGIYRSENQGEQWTKLQGIPYAARRTQVIVQDPGDSKTFYAGTTAGLWVSRDEGESWTRTTTKDWVVNSVAVVAGAKGGERLVLGLDGNGIEVSDDAGVTFHEANHGFTHTVVKALVRDVSGNGRLLMLVERASSELLESGDEGKSWSELPLWAVVRGKKSELDAGEAEELLASPWGWMVRMRDGRMWRWDASKSVWTEWVLRSATVVRSAKGGKRTAMRAVKATGPLAFSEKDAWVATDDGLMKCPESGNCTRVRAYGREEKMRVLCVLRSGERVAAVAGGKLGVSGDGGDTAVWRDLPVAAQQVNWVDVAEGGTRIYLGTRVGLYVSSGEAEWQKVGGGLPAGPMEQWLRDAVMLMASQRDGGLYVSRDEGATWSRVDRDAERGTIRGLVELRDGAVLAGSQSEGLLRLKM